MAEDLIVKSVAWVTAIVVDRLADYFADSVETGIGKWSKKLKEMTTSSEEEAIRGVRNDLHMGMTALSASISAVNQETRDGTKAILDKLVELRDSQHHDQQLAYLKRSVDAIGDLTSKMYAAGNPKNVDLLLKASNNAEEAARSPRGNFSTKLQAYRLWVVTEYLHEVTMAKGECFLAKKTAMNILGRVIIRDLDILNICRKYSSPRSRSRKKPPAPELVTSGEPEECGWPSRSGDDDLPEEVSEAMEFLFDIVSSVIMLPPLEKEVACPNLLTANATGSLTVGAEVPHDVIFAMGRYCSAIPRVARAYPAVSSVALEAWNAGKEELALDNFFVGMGGDDWIVRNGWTSKDVALGDRFGITVENGHVTKISLATNNLQGCLTNDLVDCEHLRELVLHGNSIFGVVPPKLQRFIDSKQPGIVVTGIAERGATPPVLLPPCGSPDLSRVNTSVSLWSAPTITGTPRSTEPQLRQRWASHSGSPDELSPPKPSRKKKSLLQKAGKFFKAAIASDFAVGFAATCPRCRGKMAFRDSKPVCTRCSHEDQMSGEQ